MSKLGWLSPKPLWVWAARDIMRHPYQAVLSGAALALLVAAMGGALLLSHALSNTASTLLEGAPSLVIRRLSAGGWAPMPAQEALRAAESVPGILRAAIRTWGVASSDNGPVTVVGFNEIARDGKSLHQSFRAPRDGEAVIGPGIAARDGRIELSAQRVLEFKVIGTLDSKAGMAAHDIVVVDENSARNLLGIPEGFGSDLAVYVLHRSEEEAIIPDLHAAFSLPVQIVTRSQTIGTYAAGSARQGGIALIMLTPAALALALLVAATVRDTLGRRHEVGLLKAMGWTTGDVVRLQLIRAVLIAAPAAATGMAVSYALVLWPGISWPGRLLLGWRTTPPEFYLNGSDAGFLLAEVAALSVLPYLIATLWPAVKGAAADPQELL